LATSVPAVKQSKPVVSGRTWRFFGTEISVRKAAVPVTDISPLVGGGWFPIIREPFTGAWQRNQEQRTQTIEAHYTVYSCITLIASDVSKMCVRVVEEDAEGIWNPVAVPAFSPVLRRPNRYQNRIKFIESWLVSKLRRGNTYILKQREGRTLVKHMYVLDPDRCKPLVTPDGDVYYQLSADNLAGIASQVVVPASEIIHDTMCPLFHPLCGVSPLVACGLAAMQGMSIQASATKFFQNGAVPSGILTVPGEITDDQAKLFKAQWEENYTGHNAGRVAVLGGGLKYEKLVMTAVESQLIEQLKWTAETICSCFHVPAYMVGVGTTPAYNNIEALNQQYYSQCLQALIENIELLLDEGLGLVDVQGKTYGAEFDLDGLLRMDTATQIEALAKAVGGSIMPPNVALKRQNLKPVEGGDTIYMQQQNYSLAALSRRDAQPDPFATAKAPPALPAAAAASTPADDTSLDDAAKAQLAAWSLRKSLAALPPLRRAA
jgi:HK97 family phage portal protein